MEKWIMRPEDYARVCRLFNQRIDGEKFEKPEEVVRWMGALQAQDYQQSLWAVGLRTQSATMTDIEQAIAHRKIVRTWPMRGTLHFVPGDDAKWMLSLSALRMLAHVRRRQEQLELDETIMERCKELFFDALKGNRRLSRPNMMQLLSDAGINTENQRGYHILWYLSQTGLICLGPMQDKQQTFVLLDEWLPHSRAFSREESLVILAKRYFVSRGPATIHDFAWWAGLTIADARRGLEGVKSELVKDQVNGKECWMAGDARGQRRDDPSRISLLPGFDEHLLGYKDRSAVLAAEHAPKIVPGNNGIFLPTMVVAGQVIGTWKRRLKKNALEVVLDPFTQLDASEESVMEAAQCYSNFMGLPLSSVEMREE
jgi:winged helix DNA-binding protein